MRTVSSKLDDQGRVFLPSAIRKAMAIEPGAEIVLAFENGSVTLQSRDEAIAAIQQRLRGRRPGRRSAVKEFLAERRREAKREREK